MKRILFIIAMVLSIKGYSIIPHIQPPIIIHHHTTPDTTIIVTNEVNNPKKVEKVEISDSDIYVIMLVVLVIICYLFVSLF